MAYRQRLSRLEAHSDLRYPKEQIQVRLNFISPDGTQTADFATTLDDDRLSLHRRPEETIAMFKERVSDELSRIDEHNKHPRKNPVRIIVFRPKSERSTD